MRKVLQILVLIVPFLAMGQSKYEGTYLFPTKRVYEVVTEVLSIEADGRFKYFYYDQVFVKLGQGKIIESKDSLILKFERIAGADYKDIQTKSERGDSISIHLKVLFKGVSPPRVGGRALIRKLLVGAEIDPRGLSQFRSPRPKTTDTLEVNQFGYFPIVIPIDPKYSSVNGIVIMSNTFYFDKGDVLKYHVDEKRRIQCYPGNYYYSKTSKDKARKIIDDWGRKDVKLTL